MIAVKVNGKSFELDIEPETPLLWVLRDTIGLTGTKSGCGAGHCGACTVHIDGTPARSCLVSVGGLAGREIVTIESIVENKNNSVVKAWIEEQVPQCGYCQAGQLMSATALLARHPQGLRVDGQALRSNGHDREQSPRVFGRDRGSWRRNGAVPLSP